MTLLWAAHRDDAGLDAMYAMMSDTSRHGIYMRQSSPWAGVLSAQERSRVLSEFVERWEDMEWEANQP